MLQKFRYYARSRKNELAIGTVRAQTIKDATAQALKKHQQIYLAEAEEPFVLLRLFRLHIGLIEKIVLVKNLHVMLKAGMPIDEAFNFLHQQSTRHATKKITAQIMKQLSAGNSLSSALGAFPSTFSPFFINMIYVGEKSGTLDINLEHLGSELEHSLELRRKVRGAALYPLIILVSTVILGGLMIRWVLPQLIRVFKSIDIPLPTSTRIFLQGAELLQNYSFMIVVVVVSAVLLFRLILRQRPMLHAKWIRLLLKIPLIGTVLASYNLAQVTRTLGILLRAGIPLTDALDITALATDNIYYKLELIRSKQMVSQGLGLGESLARQKAVPLVAQLISIGERSGNLDVNLLYLSDFYNNRIDYLTKDLPTVLEPILLLTVGLMVGFVAISILSPIYEFTASVGR